MSTHGGGGCHSTVRRSTLTGIRHVHLLLERGQGWTICDVQVVPVRLSIVCSKLLAARMPNSSSIAICVWRGLHSSSCSSYCSGIKRSDARGRTAALAPPLVAGRARASRRHAAVAGARQIAGF